MDCFFNEGIKVLYRVAMAILQLFNKYSAPQNSEWMALIQKDGVDVALPKFCQEIPVSLSIFIIFYIDGYQQENIASRKQYIFQKYLFIDLQLFTEIPPTHLIDYTII